MELFSKYVLTDGRSNVAPSARKEVYVCGTGRTGTAALRVCLVSSRSVRFHSRSECTGEEKHLLPVAGISKIRGLPSCVLVSVPTL